MFSSFLTMSDSRFPDWNPAQASISERRFSKHPNGSNASTQTEPAPRAGDFT